MRAGWRVCPPSLSLGRRRRWGGRRGAPGSGGYGAEGGSCGEEVAVWAVVNLQKDRSFFQYQLPFQRWQKLLRDEVGRGVTPVCEGRLGGPLPSPSVVLAK